MKTIDGRTAALILAMQQEFGVDINEKNQSIDFDQLSPVMEYILSSFNDMLCIVDDVSGEKRLSGKHRITALARASAAAKSLKDTFGQAINEGNKSSEKVVAKETPRPVTAAKVLSFPTRTSSASKPGGVAANDIEPQASNE